MPGVRYTCSHAGDTIGSLSSAAHALEMLKASNYIKAVRVKSKVRLTHSDQKYSAEQRERFKPLEAQTDGRKVLPLPIGMLPTHARALHNSLHCKRTKGRTACSLLCPVTELTCRMRAHYITYAHEMCQDVLHLAPQPELKRTYGILSLTDWEPHPSPPCPFA